MSNEIKPNQLLLGEIKTLIEDSKQQVAVTVNATLSMLYWNIGKKINEERLLDKRAEYGKQIVATLARQLTTEYGSGRGEKQLRQCMQFALVYPNEQIVYALRRQLNWTQIRKIEMCKIEKF